MKKVSIATISCMNQSIHNAEEFFHMIIFPTDNSVYQLDTGHECFGIELKNLKIFETRFESIIGNKLDFRPEFEEPLELSYKERVNILEKKRRTESISQFVRPIVYTSDRDPSNEYLDSQGIPKLIIIKDLNNEK